MSSTIQEKFTSFYELLRYVIEFRRFSQRELAQKIGKDEAQISRYLSGEVVPYPRTQKKLFSALEVDVIKVNEDWVVNLPQRSQDSANEPKVVYADKVELPEDGKLSRDQMKLFLEQIELTARMLKDSL
ncbi:MAG: helix-turn-helix transcriptional regulator [Balneola sp.]